MLHSLEFGTPLRISARLEPCSACKGCELDGSWLKKKSWAGNSCSGHGCTFRDSGSLAK